MVFFQAKQHKDCHIDDEELDQFVRFLMFSEAFQQLSPQARDELGITSTRLSCYDRCVLQYAHTKALHSIAYHNTS